MKFNLPTFLTAVLAGFIGGITSILAFFILMGLGDSGVL